ncbi:MAG: TetR family transcriptional regulator [Kofleriaceae bacterium]|nr:TetR family transcriptional regulator [Kofleriaceae bacterium]MCB9571099.1 TetR family transcriptional regulator [Kofleriaceae bacterium]
MPPPADKKKSPRRAGAASGARPTTRRPAPRRHALNQVRSAVRESASELYRDHILAAAEQEFTGRGYAATRMADIARRAEMSVGALYRHFASKEAIFASMVERAGNGFVASLERAAETPSPRERITALIATSLAFIEDNRSMFQVFTQLRDDGIAACDEISGRICSVHDRVDASYRQALADGIAAGQLDATIPLDDQLAFFHGAIHGFIESWIVSGAVGALSVKAPLVARLTLRALGGVS